MNNAKMWLVVKPTVGIPLFLGAVAVGSFAVHVAVLTNTGWLANFLQGKPIASAKATIPGANAVVTFNDETNATLTLPDGRTARVLFEPSLDGKKTAMAAELPPDR
jgi:light-harvesting protein B-800-850 alpha chain